MSGDILCERGGIYYIKWGYYYMRGYIVLVGIYYVRGYILGLSE